jgi:hypothetical protein
MLRRISARLWQVGWLAAWVVAARRGLPITLVYWLTFVFGCSGVIAGLYLFFHGFELLRSKRWIEDTPVTKVSAAAVGQVKVLGRAIGPYTLLSPLAGVNCYYYKAVAWDGRSTQDDQTLEGRATETLFTPFFVEDETGRLMIDPRGARLDLPYEYDEAVSGNSMSECTRRFLRRHGLSTSGDTTVSEYAIKPGDSILVFGTLGENRGLGSMADANQRDSFGTYVSREAADLQRLEQLEALGLPQSDLRRATPHSNDSDFDLHPRVVLRAGDDRLRFVLSREQPQRMIDALARKSVLGIWGGPAVALFSLGLVMKWLAVW